MLQVNCIVLALLPVIESHVMLTLADKEADVASIIAHPSSGIIFTSPEVITKVGHPLQQALSHLPVVLFAIDEAHKVSEWGVSDDA
jgi:superfamily II DNA helicase RecQ